MIHTLLQAALRAYEKDLASDPSRRHDSAVRDAIQRRKLAFAGNETNDHILHHRSEKNTVFAQLE